MYKHEQLSSIILNSLAIRTLFNNWPGHFQNYCSNKIIVHPNIAKMIFMCHILARYMFIILFMLSIEQAFIEEVHFVGFIIFQVKVVLYVIKQCIFRFHPHSPLQ